MKRTLAICSPSKNAYSETFIQAHKNLPFTIKYYYDGLLPTQLEGTESLYQFSFSEKIKIRTHKHFTLSEHAFVNSLKREKVDCILAEYGLTGAVVLKIAAHLGLPMVVYFFGYDASVRSVLEAYENGYKKVFDYAAAVMVVSNKMKDDLIALGCPAGKLFVSACGPNPVFFDNKPSYDQPQFIAVGRFVEKKAPYLTILAFKKVVDTYPAAKLIMVGDGELLWICRKLVEALKLGDNIELRGVLAPAEIQLLFEGSIAFVQHSIIADDGDAEGVPVAVLDAQAAALPVISTYHSGIPEIVIHNETGLLANEHDLDGMAENMLRLITEKGLAQKLGAAGRERVKEYFTMEKHLGDLAAVINVAILKKEIV
jgi:colanic acid/amylovoran biosynthesis glycosyltransferase